MPARAVVIYFEMSPLTKPFKYFCIFAHIVSDQWREIPLKYLNGEVDAVIWRKERRIQFEFIVEQLSEQ